MEISLADKRVRLILAALCAAAAILLMADPLHLTNTYLRADTFETITVHEGDTASAIACRYTTDSDKQAELLEAIIDINGLTPDAALRAGQSLRIPILGRQRGSIADSSP